MALAFALAALSLSGQARIAHILLLAALLGVVNAVDSPTRHAFVVEMVGRENLASAVALNTSMVTGASFVRPALAGFAIETLGEGWCFALNGVSFLAVIAGLLAMRDLPSSSAALRRESMRVRLAEGFRFAASHEGVRALLLLLALTALAGLPFGTLMPGFASTILHGNERTLGLLMGAPGLGAVLVGVTLASRQKTGSYQWTGAACVLFGVLLVALSQARTLGWAIAILIAMGMATMIQLTATNTLLQASTPDALRARVMAIWFMILSGCVPLGSVAVGWLALAFGPVLPIALGGIVCVLGGSYFAWWAWSDSRAERSFHSEQEKAL